MVTLGGQLYWIGGWLANWQSTHLGVSERLFAETHHVWVHAVSGDTGPENRQHHPAGSRPGQNQKVEVGSPCWALLE